MATQQMISSLSTSVRAHLPQVGRFDLHDTIHYYLNVGNTWVDEVQVGATQGFLQGKSLTASMQDTLVNLRSAVRFYDLKPPTWVWKDACPTHPMWSAHVKAYMEVQTLYLTPKWKNLNELRLSYVGAWEYCPIQVPYPKGNKVPKGKATKRNNNYKLSWEESLEIVMEGGKKSPNRHYSR